MIAADDDTEKSMMDMARAERAELAAFLTPSHCSNGKHPACAPGGASKKLSHI